MQAAGCYNKHITARYSLAEKLSVPREWSFNRLRTPGVKRAGKYGRTIQSVSLNYNYEDF